MTFDGYRTMLSIHLTLAQVVSMLRVLAEREPDRIGKDAGGVGCVYAKVNGFVLTPVCIVGQMFADLGLLRLLMSDPNDLDGFYAGNLSACSTESGFWQALEKFGITADEDAKSFMHSVQRRQDDDETWGQAFANAVDAYRIDQRRVLDNRLDNLFG